MMKLDKDGNFNPWCQPKYGTDASDKDITPPEGYYLLPKGSAIIAGDIPFDVYAGWLKPKKVPKKPSRCKYPNLYYYRTTTSEGRWSAWARPKQNH